VRASSLLVGWLLMCGIVGLLIKNESMRDSLGRLVTPMLDCMGDRGPDSAGLAVFSDPVAPPLRRFSLYLAGRDAAWSAVSEAARRDLDGRTELTWQESHGLLTSDSEPATIKLWLADRFPKARLLSVGRSIDLYKDVGHPREVARRYGFADLVGSHAVGHTRLATESAVSMAHSHPFTAGEDFCLVHNGSLSNPHSIRRKLEKRGIRFETDNDTEAACRFIEWGMSEGNTLEETLNLAFDELDGFFTLLIATADELVLVRDAFACKPAVAAETADYVAISSEFRSLAHLPNVQDANIFEPVPERIYSWSK